MTDLLTGRTILVVEDEMMVLLMIEDMLADLGCTAIMSAATVDQALAFIDDHRVDAATLDINLGGEDSYPIADALAARGIPFAFSTGYGDRDLHDRHGDRPVLRKPYNAADIARVFALLMAEAPTPALAA